MHLNRSIGALLATCLLTGAGVSFSLAEDHTLVWEVPGYVWTVHTQPQLSQDRQWMPMLLGRPKGQTTPVEDQVGIHFEQDYRVLKDAGTFWVYGLFDAKAGRAIKQISLEEAFGTRVDAGCAMTGNERQVEKDLSQIRTTYKIQKGAYQIHLLRTLSLISDPAVPGGKRLDTVFEVENKGNRDLDLRFSLRGRADAYATVHDSASVWIAHAADAPILVQSIAPLPRRVTVEPRSEKVPNPSYEIEGVPVSISRGERIEVMRLRQAATPSGLAEPARRQAAHLSEVFFGEPARPDLMLTTLVDRANAQRGEVITYTVAYQNVGTAPMKEVFITNPVPAEVSYVEGSAGGQGAEVQEQRDNPSQTEGEVRYIIWRIGRTLMPGDQGTLVFMATVK